MIGLVLVLRLAVCVVSLHVSDRQSGIEDRSNIVMELKVDASAGHYPSPRVTRGSKELLRSEPAHRTGKLMHVDALDVQPFYRTSLVSRNLETRVNPDDTVNGVCQKTNGLQMDSGTYVLAIEDLSDCGEQVKHIGDFSTANNALQECSKEVEKDPGCSLKFVMEDSTDVCKCVKKKQECVLRKSTTTCVYELKPPVCANTSQIVLEKADVTLEAVYPVAFESSCGNATSLGKFPDGLKTCADAVAKDSTCSHKFVFHRSRFDCLCLKVGMTCPSRDSNDYCLYQLSGRSSF